MDYFSDGLWCDCGESCPGDQYGDGILRGWCCDCGDWAIRFSTSGARARLSRWDVAAGDWGPWFMLPSSSELAQAIELDRAIQKLDGSVN